MLKFIVYVRLRPTEYGFVLKGDVDSNVGKNKENKSSSININTLFKCVSDLCTFSYIM